jgi:hypothetical protein
MKRALLLVMLAGCGGSLSEAGAGVKIIHGEAPPNCTEVGPVVGSLYRRDRVELAKNKMRNEAAEKGANCVRLEGVNGAYGSSANGTAFKCP